MCLPHHSPFPDKIHGFVSLPHHYLASSQTDKGWWLSTPTPRHALSGPSPVFTSFGRNVILAKHFPKRSLSKYPKIDFFSPHHQTRLPWIPWSRTQLLCIGWVQVGGVLALVRVPLPSVFVSFWSYAIFAIPALSPSAMHTRLCLSHVVWSVCGLLGLHYRLLFLHGLGIVWAKVSAHTTHWASISAIPLLAPAMGLVDVSLAIWAYRVCYIFP